MARFIDEDGNEWAEGRIRGLDFAEGVYGKVCAVERDDLTLVGKGFKQFEGERGSFGAEMRRDREYDRISRMDGLEGYAPRAYGKGTLEVNGERIPALLMSYVEGVGFKRAIDILAGSENALLSAAEVLGLARKLVEPFAAMERSGVVHGDLHTENVRIVLSTEGKPVVKGAGLIDFGNARRLGANGRSLYTPTPAERRQMPGSFWFESPESFSCAACPHNEDARSKPSSNMWAFGALLYYAYYRKLPHDGAARAYSSVWGSLTATEGARVRALQNFIEVKAVPLGLPMNPGDDAEDFRMLAELIRNTTLDNPAKRWTAKRCMSEIEVHFGGAIPSAEMAVSRLRAMADEGEPLAQYRLGLLYDIGLGVGKDYAEAANLYGRAAGQGIIAAQCNLGNLYCEGLGVEQDYERAAELYEQAAARGDAAAQCNLGNLCRDGLGIDRSYKRAAELYGQAAEQGHVEAQHNLGNLYFGGFGVDQDCKRAAELWGRAAERGYIPAQCNLGYLYRDALGVERSYERAAELWSQAAERGHAVSQCNLGALYYHGRGVERDIAKATDLWHRAAASGYKGAVAMLTKYGLA
ncbi:Sel1-like repeat-containing protein kinase family protein [Rubneribacter sp.]